MQTWKNTDPVIGYNVDKHGVRADTKRLKP